MKAKISLVTLGVRDFARALAFYRDGLGFPLHAYAEGDDHARLPAGDQPAEPGERLRRVIGRQQHAPPGEGRALLEVQVGDDEHALVGPP